MDFGPQHLLGGVVDTCRTNNDVYNNTTTNNYKSNLFVVISC